MDIKNYQKEPVKPLSFDEWKGNLAPSFSDETLKSMQRLHGMNYKEEFEKMLQVEYNECWDNLNGNWLLR